MRYLAAVLLLACTLAQSAPLSWAKPGANRYTGDVPMAVHNYKDIPETVRNRLEKKMRAFAYDDLVLIKRDSLKGGKYKYSPVIRDMHFGNPKSGKKFILAEVDRSAWKDDDAELGLIYHDSGHTIMVPTVCNNVSRIERLRDDPVAPLTLEPPEFEVPIPWISLEYAVPIPEIFEPRPPPRILTPMSRVFPPGGNPGTPGTRSVPPEDEPENVVPEPSTWLLMITALAVLAATNRRKR